MTSKHTATGHHISRSHKTVIGLAGDIALALNKSGIITKISLAIISPNSTRFKKLVLVRDQFGLRLSVHDPPAKQELYVSAPDREQVIACLQRWSKERNLKCIVR